MTFKKTKAWITLEHHGTQLSRACAPKELQSVPLYFVQAEQLGRVGLSSLAGCTSQTADLLCRGAGVIDDWQGRGIAIIYSATNFETFPDMEWRRLDFLAMALHEAGHAIVEGYVGRLADRETVDDDTARAFSRHVANDFAGCPSATPAAQAEYHGADFLRTILHLSFRAEREGTRLLPGWIWHGADGLAIHPSFFARVLRQECERMVRTPFAQILATPAPEEFSELWQQNQDALKWRRERLAVQTTLEPEKEPLKMTITDILWGIKKVFGQQQRDTLISLADLTRAILDGKQIDPAKAAEILRAANKTPEDLEKSVERLRQRREERKKIDLAKDADAKIEAARGKLAEIESEFQAARQKFEAAAGLLHYEIAEEQRKDSEARDAKRVLRETTDTDHQGRRAEQDAELKQRKKERDELKRKLDAAVSANSGKAINAGNAAVRQAEHRGMLSTDERRGVYEAAYRAALENQFITDLKRQLADSEAAVNEVLKAQEALDAEALIVA